MSVTSATFSRRQARNQIVKLKHKTNVFPSIARQGPIVELGKLLAFVKHRASARHIEPAQNIEKRTLAAAGGPEQNHELTRVELQVHAPQSVHLDLAHMVDLREAASLEHRYGLPISTWFGRVVGRKGAHAAEFRLQIAKGKPPTLL